MEFNSKILVGLVLAVGLVGFGVYRFVFTGTDDFSRGQAVAVASSPVVVASPTLVRLVSDSAVVETPVIVSPTVTMVPTLTPFPEFGITVPFNQVRHCQKIAEGVQYLPAGVCVEVVIPDRVRDFEAGHNIGWYTSDLVQGGWGWFADGSRVEQGILMQSDYRECDKPLLADVDYKYLLCSEESATLENLVVEGCYYATVTPTPVPTVVPTLAPTPVPTPLPTLAPTPVPTAVPWYSSFRALPDGYSPGWCVKVAAVSATMPDGAVYGAGADNWVYLSADVLGLPVVLDTGDWFQQVVFGACGEYQ